MAKAIRVIQQVKVPVALNVTGLAKVVQFLNGREKGLAITVTNPGDRMQDEDLGADRVMTLSVAEHKSSDWYVVHLNFTEVDDERFWSDDNHVVTRVFETAPEAVQYIQNELKAWYKRHQKAVDAEAKQYRR